MKEPIAIKGAKFIYELQEGEQWAICGNVVIVIHPLHKPKIVEEDGIVKELEFFPQSRASKPTRS